MMYLITGLILFGVILTILRIIKGKELENRVVAVDTLTTITSAILLIAAHLSNNGLLLDVVLVYAILSFTSVIAMARYLEGGL
ncbi:monovalent cation/H+ antiporter complex subunit F [Helicovermis profundi]|uniref:Monovalent cation/H+ antiporter complex subunit F n=1 Tax=Helicovermis profundi TaxID=3065157 RepID=A0AAU9E5J0_9FIRM|nr:monovalent cation/H+ antiporter complex subunit F [Clostridia bacterium S502]